MKRLLMLCGMDRRVYNELLHCSRPNKENLYAFKWCSTLNKLYRSWIAHQPQILVSSYQNSLTSAFCPTANNKINFTSQLNCSILTSAFFFLFFCSLYLCSYSHILHARWCKTYPKTELFCFSVQPFIKQTIQEYHKTDTCPEYFIFLNDLYIIRKDF